MKWKTDNKSHRTVKPKPFLILPQLSDSNSITECCEMTKKKPNLKLFTKSWPSKKKDDKSEERPLTATLDKPQILDIKFIGKIDMSSMRKEFLFISNLCRAPIISVTSAKPYKKSAKSSRRRNNTPIRPCSLPNRPNLAKSHSSETTDDSLEDSSLQRTKNKQLSKLTPKKIMAATVMTCKKQPVKKGLISDANNNSKTMKSAQKHVHTDTKTPIKSTKLPEPCKTCGRPDQPERFHSHPVKTLKPARKMNDVLKIPSKNSVQKPVAIKYKSKQTEVKTAGQGKISSPVQRTVVQHSGGATTPIKDQDKSDNSRASSGKGPRTLICYICARGFGTASLSIHEPKCLEKWERENASLPKNLQRHAPKRPEKPMTPEEWNLFAWETSQASLVPCENCGRTFLPDRLMVHQRSCLSQRTMNTRPPTENNFSATNPTSPTSPVAPSTGITCKICGRMFGSHSIKIHEPQCLKKWQMANGSLPVPQNLPDSNPSTAAEASQKRTPEPDAKQQEERPSSSKRPPMFPCYLCGRLFGVSSIYIHEPQCLKKWRAENEKLPPHKRRQEPLKPDIKFTRDGKIDFDAMNDSNWKTHLNQLVPCSFCGRTFNPDRVDVHERSCKSQ